MTPTHPRTQARPETQADIERDEAERCPYLDRLPRDLCGLVTAYQNRVYALTGRRPDMQTAVMRLTSARDQLTAADEPEPLSPLLILEESQL